MAEDLEKEINQLSQQLTEGEKGMVQVNAMINLLVDKGLVTSQEYLKEYVEALKEVREISKGK